MTEQNKEEKTQNFEFKMPELLFPNIFKTFRIAMQPARLMTAFLALAFIFSTGWLMDLRKTVVVSGKLSTADLRSSTLNGSRTWPTELHCFVTYPDRMDNYLKVYKERTKPQRLGVFKVFSNFCVVNFNEGTLAFVQLNFNKTIQAITNCFLACVWVLEYHTIYGVIFLLVSFVALSLAGGAICKGAAVHFARDERLGLGVCISFAFRRWIPLVFASTAPLVLAALLGFVIVSLLGLMTNIPYAGEIILAIFFFLVLICGAMLAYAAIWGLGGFSLMYSAVAYEKTDTFDAMCRGYSYVSARPWRLAIYTILAGFYGGICYLFVRFFAFLMLVLSRWFLDFGLWVQSQKGSQIEKIDAIWPKPEYFNFFGIAADFSKPLTQKIACGVVQLEVLAVSGLVMAFVLSFYFSAGAIIYCLLRKKIDNIPLDSVFIETVSAQDTQQQV